MYVLCLVCTYGDRKSSRCNPRPNKEFFRIPIRVRIAKPTWTYAKRKGIVSFLFFIFYFFIFFLLFLVPKFLRRDRGISTLFNLFDRFVQLRSLDRSRLVISSGFFYYFRYNYKKRKEEE